MAFERGSASFRMFYVPELPEDVLERFAASALPPLNTLAQEELHGWVGFRHVLDREITEGNAYLGGYLRLTLTQVQKKIPSSLLAAECRMEEVVLMQAEEIAFVSQTQRREIREQVRERLLPQMPPQLKGIDFVHDRNSGIIYCSATSEKQVEAFQLNFLQTTGKAIEPVDAFSAAMQTVKSDVRDWKPANFSTLLEDGAVDSSAGREFLTWLWFMSEERGGTFQIKGAGEVALAIEGPLMLVNEAAGVHETVLKKGNPLNSPETRIALLAGKMLKRAKISVARGEQVWSFTFDADDFVFRSMKLPPTESYDAVTRFQERMVHLEEFRSVFLELFRQFATARKNPEQWKETQDAMKLWVQERPAMKVE